MVVLCETFCRLGETADDLVVAVRFEAPRRLGGSDLSPLFPGSSCFSLGSGGGISSRLSSLGGSGYVPSDSYSLSPAGAVASAPVPSTALRVAAQVTFCGKRINSSVGKAVAGLL